MNVFEKNKTFIAIIFGALIIGGAIYFSRTPAEPINQQATPLTLPAPPAGPPTEPQVPQTGSCINFREAPTHVGETRCVTGTVDHVFVSSKGNTFLNFCPDYRTCPFFAVVFSSDSHKFSNLRGLQGKTVEISGLIRTYQGRLEIIVNDPSQLKVR